ncbi:MAG TPA: M2 family metallopeptidase [Chthonomonadales bacterium]|nr:M2 family metallopeptidase [Chthonomonadales bacterium]
MVSNDQRIQQFIDSHLEVIRPLSRDVSLAWWESALTGSEEAAVRAAELSARYMKVYANPEEYAFLKGIAADSLRDPLLARQHNILLRAYQGAQMPPEVIDRLVQLEKEVDQEFNNYRAEVRGQKMTENEIRQILRESEDVALRKDAWEGSKAIGARVAAHILEMVRLRNEVARAHGFPNHYTKSMLLDELDEERVFALFDELAERTEPLWVAWKAEFDAAQAARFGISPEELRPWHYTDQFFQEAPPGEVNFDRYFADKNLEEITRRFFAAIGLPIEEVLAHSDLYEKPGKNQHAFCTDIDREGDVRVLCNVRPNEHWMGTMLHEFGHAVYDLYTDRNLPFLLRGPAHTLSTEAIAEMMGRFSKEEIWLQLYAGVPAEEAERVAAMSRAEMRVKFLIATRWILTMCYFERAMYRHPEQDLNTLWWDMVEKYQHIRRPDNRHAPDWASKIHLALAPVYYHNYLLGEMMAAQLLHYLRTVVLAGEPPEALFTNPKVGAWLKEYIFQPGATRPWEDALEIATGEALNPAYFVAQLMQK